MKNTTQASDITDEMINNYRRNGFIRIPQVLTPEEVDTFRQAALVADKDRNKQDKAVFTQKVNVWRRNEIMKQLTLHPNIAAIAQRLAGATLRLWHDQVLIKEPHNEAPTEFHQDRPYWPHTNSPNPLTAWIALCDIPVERGCMSFLPGSHRFTDLPAQSLKTKGNFFSICPSMQWVERVTIPLQAGDCTFHHGFCAHTANANETDEPRVAHAIIYMDATTRFSGKEHVVTKNMGHEIGDLLDGELFPAFTD